MEVKATIKFARISPKKAASTVAALRKQKVAGALEQLRFTNNKTAGIVYKLLHSAVSNAKNNYNLKEDNLLIKTITVSDGPRYKRYWLRSRGSADTLLKRTSHFNVVLAEIKPTTVKKVVKPATVSPIKPSDKDNDSTDSKTDHKVRLADERRQGPATNVKNVFKNRTTNK